MDFELSADQVALQDAARELLDGYSTPTSVRAVVDAGGGLDPKLWAAMVDQGWPGIATPASLGGVGLGWVEAAVLLEQVGAHLAPAPFLHHVVALASVVEASTGDGADDAAPALGWVEPLVSGSTMATVAWGPVDATRADDGTGWTVSGTPEPVVYAPSTDLVIVHAVTDDGEAGVFAVDIRQIRPKAEPAMDLTRELGWLALQDVSAIRLGGPDAVERLLDRAATALSAELLGASEHAMHLAVDYAKDREQFGRPIGSFQAVKHRCADMLVDVEGMRSAVYYAAWCLEADDRDRSVAASTAKTWCSDASKRVMASSLQVHGGIGFTWECDVHLYLKRAQLDQVGFGDASFHRGRLAALLRTRVEAGESVI